MKRRIFFDGELNDENVAKFLTELETAEKDGVDVIVLLSSQGGFECYPSVLSMACDEYAHGLEIHVTWIAQSGAFLWCCQTKRPVVFLPVSSGAIHIASRSVQTRDLKDLNSDAMFLVKEMEKRNKVWLESMNPFVSESEYTRLLDGKIVGLTAERSQHISDTLSGRKT